MLYNFLRPVLFMWCITFPMWIFYRAYLSGNKKRTGQPVNPTRELTLCVLILYLCTVFAFTNFPAPFTSYEMPGVRSLNLLPVLNTWQDLQLYVAQKDWAMTGFALQNIIGNILLFIPTGIFLPGLFPYFRSLKRMVIVCLIGSASIEMLQFILRQFGYYRTTDIDDVILNTLGGILGWWMYSWFGGDLTPTPLQRKRGY